MSILIRNGQVVDPLNETTSPLDILVENGKITRIEKQLTDEADTVIDASGLIIAPGLVDMHVHFRDPGQTHKEDIITGCAAAAHGGITAVACMANTDPTIDTPEMVQYVKNRAAEACGVRVYPIAALSKGLKGEELTDAEALKQAGAVAISDDGCNVDSSELMRNALIKTSTAGIPVLCHCEVSDMVGNYAVNEGRVSRQLWLPGRPAIAEELSVMRDCMLAEETGAAVHICHISTAKAVDIVRQFKKRGVHITCETCPQYFTITENEILRIGSLARVNPPLRLEQDVQGIIRGLCDGTIDAIATDHAPHSDTEKQQVLSRAPSGLVGLETSLALALTHLYHTGRITLPRLVKLMSLAPASILGISGGRLVIGGDADITIFDPERTWVVDTDHFRSKSRNTPFEGCEVKGKTTHTIVAGNLIYQDRSRV